MIGYSVRQERPRGRCSAYGWAGMLCLILPTMILLVRNLPAMRSADPGISKAAADSCNAKISRLEAFDAAHDPVKKQTTRLSETEMNSYLAFVLSPHYNACLKSIRLKFEEGHLQGVAAVDFDRLQLNPTQLLTSLLRKMLTGVHTLTVRGILVSGTGKANFRLEEARFDSMTLPNLLVAEIITTVGRKQNPPFDPMQPSTLPYRIQKVDVHAGYIVVYQ